MNWTAYVVILCISTIADNALQVRASVDSILGGGDLDDPGRASVRLIWLVVAVWTLARPSSVCRYFALCVVGSFAIVSMMPQVPNHFVLELALFAGSLLVFVSIRDSTQQYAALRVTITGSLFVVYGWAVLHKLNFGFLEPSTSCAAVFLDVLHLRLGLPAPGSTVRSFSVSAVLLAELMIPLMLAWPRTRAVGVVAGIGMHFTFGLFIPGFSVLVWGIYFLLLAPISEDAPASRFACIASCLRRVTDSIPPHGTGRRLVFEVAVGVLALVAAGFLGDVPRLRKLDSAATTFIVLAMLIGSALVFALARGTDPRPVRSLSPRALAIAIAVPLVLWTNGLVPYLGVRNTLAFSMFSNLRTESGQTNHLFLPVFTNRFSTLTDQVRVLESSDPTLRRYVNPQRHQLWNWSTIIAPGLEAEFELPFFMLRYRAQQVREAGAPMFSIKFRRGGETYAWTPEQVESLAPVGWMARRVFHSKGTPLPPHENVCMW